MKAQHIIEPIMEKWQSESLVMHLRPLMFLKSKNWKNSNPVMHIIKIQLFKSLNLCTTNIFSLRMILTLFRKNWVISTSLRNIGILVNGSYPFNLCAFKVVKSKYPVKLSIMESIQQHFSLPTIQFITIFKIYFWKYVQFLCKCFSPIL